jgi:pimeloyl-ACP methyl ester carboxylesterase
LRLRELFVARFRTHKHGFRLKISKRPRCVIWKPIVTQKSIAATVAAITIGGFLLFILTGAIFCGMTLYVPRRLGSPPPNAMTVAVAARDKVNLSGWWLQPSKPNGGCVVVLHGIADSRVSTVGFAPMFLDQGYAVLLPDSRAHGASEGRFVTYGLLEKYDVIAWANWMKKAGCRNLYGLGESLGALILIEAAALQPVFAAIVAECPYADLRETAEYRARQMLPMPAFVALPAAKIAVSSAIIYASWVHGLDFRQVSPIRSIVHAGSPILLIHGLKDLRTPASNSERLARANPLNPLWLVPNALHTGAAAAEPDEFQRRVLGWFGGHRSAVPATIVSRTVGHKVRK